MLFCKYMKDKEKLSELLNKNVIEAVANTKIPVNEKEEKGNACEGLQGIIDDAIHEEKKKAVKEKERQIKKGNEPKRRGNVQTWQRSG